MKEGARMARDSAGQSLDEKCLIVPRLQHLSEREIRKQLLFDLLQDKATLLPAALSVSALIYSLLFAPVLGGLQIALSIALAAAMVGGAVFIWRYGFRFQHNFALKSQELLALFEAQNLYFEEQRLLENGKLEAGFSEINATQGLNILRALDLEYRLLRPVLSSGKEMELLSASDLEARVQETYFRGLSVLQDVLELERAISTTDQAQLQSEIAALQLKAAAQQERAGDIDERIGSNQERILIVRNLQQRLEKLLYQAKRCEAALGKARIELAAFKAGASDAGLNAVIAGMQKTIDRAREVQQELKKMGS
jgi:hypothetical protein